MLLIYLSCAWITGILLGTKLSIHPLWLAISLLPLPLIFLFRQRKKFFITVSLLTLAVLGGMIRYQSSLPVAEGENYVQYYNDQTAVELKGVISQAPELTTETESFRAFPVLFRKNTIVLSGWKLVPVMV